MRLPSHPRRGRRKRRGAVNTSKREANIIYSPWGPEMLKSSPMLSSIYSHVKKLLRKTPSKYKAINRKEKWHRGDIGIREGGKGKHKGRTYLRKTPRL